MERPYTPSIGSAWSLRPHSVFQVCAKRGDFPGCVYEAKSSFVELFEEWHAPRKITPIGHSLGAYFSAVYVLRYPERVDSLILLSPISIPPPFVAQSHGACGSSSSSCTGEFSSLLTDGALPRHSYHCECLSFSRFLFVS